MKRAQAELFANDIALIVEGVDKFFARIAADPALRGQAIPEIVAEIQETGTLDHLSPTLERVSCSIEQALAAIAGLPH